MESIQVRIYLPASAPASGLNQTYSSYDNGTVQGELIGDDWVVSERLAQEDNVEIRRLIPDSEPEISYRCIEHVPARIERASDGSTIIYTATSQIILFETLDQALASGLQRETVEKFAHYGSKELEECRPSLKPQQQRPPPSSQHRQPPQRHGQQQRPYPPRQPSQQQRRPHQQQRPPHQSHQQSQKERHPVECLIQL